jgi:hypothetical protein
MTRASVETDEDALRLEWWRFGRAAAEFVGGAVPELRQHKEVGRWLAGLWPYN